MEFKRGGRRGLVSGHTSWGVKRARFKALAGRGRKRSKWASELYPVLRSDFEKLRAVGLKFSVGVLKTHAVTLIRHAPEGSSFHQDVMDRGRRIQDLITYRWIQHFLSANRIVLRSQTGKLLVSPAQELLIEKSVAFHLGELKRGFESGLLNENRIENADETHF